MISSGTLSLLITIVTSFSQVWGVHPNIFVPSSNATCQPDYVWMNNAEQKDPCLTVAYVIAACVGDTWTQPALPSGYKYDSPNGTTATPCYCSWSCYNLMMACTLCQGPGYTSDTTTWPSFSENCPSNYKDEVFPSGYVLAGNISIPYWATINPANWSAELFNIGQAETYANQSQPDYWPSISNANSSSNSTSTNIGAIIGGTIGGAAGLLFILIGGYFLYKHRQNQRSQDATLIQHMGTPMTNTHSRLPSDPSTIFPSTLTASPPPMSYVTTQQHGMGMSVYTPPSYSSFRVTSPPTETASLLTAGNTVVQHTRPIPIV